MIVAERNGVKRTFSDAIWANMPPDCYGWEIVTTQPVIELASVSDPVISMPEKLQPTTQVETKPKRRRK